MLIRILCYVIVLLCVIEPLLVLSDSTPVRLVGGHSNATGLVELFVKGEWVTVYSSYFGYYDGKVVCRMLGFNNSLVRVFNDGNALFGNTGYKILREQFGCNGDEDDLNECSSQSGWTPSTHYSNDAGLSCEETKLRLVDGDTHQSGRVELFFNGDWRTICDDHFDLHDARVICNSLGFSNTGVVQAYTNSHYGQGYGSSVISRLDCKGSESDIKYCCGTWARSSCNHWNDAGVNCGGTQIRLVNGPTNTSGRVEVYHNGHWGTICGRDGFDIRTAYVICRMLGIYKEMVKTKQTARKHPDMFKPTPRELCRVCGKTFKKKEYLTQHMRRIHRQSKSSQGLQSLEKEMMQTGDESDWDEEPDVSFKLSDDTGESLDSDSHVMTDENANLDSSNNVGNKKSARDESIHELTKEVQGTDKTNEAGSSNKTDDLIIGRIVRKSTQPAPVKAPIRKNTCKQVDTMRFDDSDVKEVDRRHLEVRQFELKVNMKEKNGRLLRDIEATDDNEVLMSSSSLTDLNIGGFCQDLSSFIGSDKQIKNVKFDVQGTEIKVIVKYNN